MEVRRTKNVATRIVFPIVDADGDVVSSAAGLDSELTSWADGSNPGAFSDATNEATEIGSSGVYYLSLTAGEMNYDYIYVQVKTSTAGAKTQHILINTTLQRSDVINIEGSDATDQIRDAVVDDATRIDASALNTASGRIQGDITTTILGRIDAAVSTRAPESGGNVAAIKAKTDNLPASPAAVGSAMTISVGTGAGQINASGGKVPATIAAGDIANNALTAAALAADAGAEIADAVWDEALAGHSGAGSAGAALTGAGSAGDPWGTALPGAYGAGTAGKIIGDNLNAKVGDVKAKTDNLPASPAATGAQMDIVNAPNATALGAIADKLLGRTLAGGGDGGRTVRQALRALRNKVSFGAKMTVYREDDSTTDWQAAFTTNAAAEPITEIDPD